MKHPFEAEPNHPEILTPEADNGANTVMSYDQNIRATKLGPLDITAAQVLYGPATAKNGGFVSFTYDPRRNGSRDGAAPTPNCCAGPAPTIASSRMAGGT